MFNILKLLLAIIGVSFLAEVSFGQGDAPAILRGLNQADKSIGAFIRTPNGQVTKISSSSALIETGNNNILENPNFEHSVYDTSWIIGSGTSSKVDVNIDNTKVFSGLNALKMTMAAASLGVFNVSPTGNQAYKDGVQGLVSVRIKTTVSGIRVCQRKGFAITTNCVNVNPDGKWNLYKVPSILGEFYNGVEITSSPAVVTGDVYIDDAFVGAVDLKVDAPSINTQSSILDQTATFGAVAITGALTVSSGSGVYSYNSGTGVYTLLKNATVTVTNAQSAGTATAIIPAIYVNGGLRSLCHSPSAINQWCEASYTSKHLAGEYFSINNAQATTNSQKITVSATEYVATSVYSSNNADTDWASCGLTGAAFTGFGSSVPTPSLQCKRQGSDLLMKGSFTAGTTPTAVEARMALPVWNGVQLVSAGASIIPSIQPVGVGGRSDAPVGHGILVEPSVSYLTFSQYADATRFFLTKQNGSTIANTGSVFPFNARIPINGWNNSNIIIGQFNGLQTCTDTLACTDTFSAKISAAGVVSGENVDWISGNASLTDTSLYAISFNTGIFTTAPNCTLTEVDAVTTLTTSVKNSTEPTSSGASVRTGFNTTASSFTKAVVPFHIICQKQGADYIGKTAMAVASDQNVRSIGSTNVDIQSVIFGTGANCASVCSTGTCSLCSQSGSKITSVTWNSTGSYNVNGLDGTKYLCTGGGEGTSYVNAYTRKDLSTSSLVRVQTGIGITLTNSAATIICIGIP